MKKRRYDFTGGYGFRLLSCEGKKKYKSESEAMVALGIQRSYGQNTEGIRPYKCRFCEGWHLGHMFADD